jgi:hypothetical protein
MVELIAYTPKEVCEALRIGRTKLMSCLRSEKSKR